MGGPRAQTRHAAKRTLAAIPAKAHYILQLHLHTYTCQVENETVSSRACIRLSLSQKEPAKEVSIPAFKAGSFWNWRPPRPTPSQAAQSSVRNARRPQTGPRPTSSS